MNLTIVNARIHGQEDLVQIACQNGKIARIAACIETAADQTLDAKGYLVTPPFVDSHLHLDTCLTLGHPRTNQSGTLLEGIRIWAELKPTLTAETIKARARQLLRWAIAKGNLYIRSHVDTSDPALTAVHALVELKKEMAPLVDLQLVAFPQDGVLRNPKGMETLIQALDQGLDLVGGIPHFERTRGLGDDSVRLLCELAADRGLGVDLHCDESDDPASCHIETLAAETVRLGLQGRVSASHLTAMHAMDNYYASKLLPLIAEARISCICNPLVNMNLQGRHDAYPKRRGLMRVPEMMAQRINVALGHDDVMDPWYPLGTHDMLDVAHMGAHALHMTGAGQMEALFDAVTVNGAKTLGLSGYGLEPGCNADLVILQARSKIEAIRLRPARLYVIRQGRVISQMAEAVAQVAGLWPQDPGGGPVDFLS